MAPTSFKLEPPLERRESISAYRSWPVIIMCGILFLLSILSSTIFLFMALYHEDWLLAGLIFILGFAAMVVCYGLWSLELWAWYATVFLLGMSALADTLFAVFRNPLPAAPRGLLAAILLGLFMTPQCRRQFRL